MKRLWIALVLGLAVVAVGCDDDDGGTDAGVDSGPGVDEDAGPGDEDAGPGDEDAGPPGAVPDTYEFDSRFEPGTSSVSYSGQTIRHILISDMKGYLGGLDTAIDGGDVPFDDGTDAGEVLAGLEYYLSIPGADRADDPIGVTTTPAPLQSVYGDISTGNLIGKLAGNDTATDYQDWSTEFRGWSDATVFATGSTVDSPTNLVRAMFNTVDANAVLRGAGTPLQSPVDTPAALPVYVTAEGLDLQQLLEKFLLGAIAFHQAADDYADDDPMTPGTGLLSDNVNQRNGTDPYSPLEHVWDEAFGYFGASRYYGSWTVADLATGDRYADRDMDSMINLRYEYNWGASVNAAKRDNGANVATTMMMTAWDGFREGRHLIRTADGELSATQLDELRGHRDNMINAWEQAIAATTIHYINDTLQAMADFDTAAYDHDAFVDHAKVWGEMKGFALSFQFNPRSPMTPAQFQMMHTLMGDRPVLEADGATAANDYRDDLREARTLIGTVYGFDMGNLGDDNGENGW